MSSRQQYNQCMRPYMTGSKTREQRQQDMCVGAKICSGKAQTEVEAKRICSVPKPPKANKLLRKGKICENQVLTVSRCVAKNIDMDKASNINRLEQALAEALKGCLCQNG